LLSALAPVYALTGRPNNVSHDRRIGGALTLVAAYKSAGIPILLGDFLISRGAERRRGRKKIARIRENLVVGWTGSLLQAENVLRRLFEGIDDRPTMESIETWFSKLELDDGPNPNLKLAGWICEDRGEFGFFWDPRVGILWGDEWFIGSGGVGFEKRVAPFRIPLDPEAPFQEETGLSALVALLAQLNCTDRISQEGHADGVGGGYEALYWSEDSHAFEYLSDALYFVLAVCIDGRGELEREPALLKESLTTYRAPIACEQSALTFSAGDGRDVWTMSAVGQATSDEKIQAWIQPQLGQPMDFRADFHGGMLMFASPTPCPPVPWAGCPWESPRLFQGGPGRFDLLIPPGFVEEMYERQRELHAAAPTTLRHISLDARR
jgi:hypothetical protein